MCVERIEGYYDVGSIDTLFFDTFEFHVVCVIKDDIFFLFYCTLIH